jgi:hypothetical protein
LKKPIILHPFLFALFPILALYSYNIDITPLYEIFIPVPAVLGFALVILFLSKCILKDYVKAGIVTTIILISFFSYGHIYYSFFYNLHIGRFPIGRERYIFPSYILLSAFIVYLALYVINKYRISDRITLFLDIMAALLIIFSMFNIVRTFIISPHVKEISIPRNSNGFVDTKGLPDIYYIILDMHASSTTLKEIYNYSNAYLDTFLESRGFYIASKSHSNYAITDLSIASSLNMEYLNNLKEKVGRNKNSKAILYQMIKNSNVSRFLKSKGYRNIHFCSGYGVTGKNHYADINYCSYSFPSEFTKVLIDTTALSSFFANFVEPDIIRNRVMYIFDELSKIPNIDGSKFTFVHLPIPHPPYVFGRNGEKRFQIGIKTKDKEKYLDQLIFVDKKLSFAIDQILSKSKTPPIIIVQADHGPDNAGDLNSPTDMLLKERFNIFNAYYLPNKDRNMLYESVSPVNSFRVVFDLYFDSKFGLLKDMSYLSKFEDLYSFSLIDNKKLSY